ncbi:MAG TPA: regulatory protein RecX [Spirochaetia bacterium]|nr:regulatory protein RecX [Spirochaetia bacterium]
MKKKKDELLPRVEEAEERAVRLLAQYEHSSYQLTVKLKKRGYPEDVILKVIEDLKGKGYLDDKRFAESWIHSRLQRHPEGRELLIAGLIAKGVDRETARSVVSSAVGEEEIAAACETAGRKLMQKSDMNREKLTQTLHRRGFSERIIQSFIDSVVFREEKKEC